MERFSDAAVMGPRRGLGRPSALSNSHEWCRASLVRASVGSVAGIASVGSRASLVRASVGSVVGIASVGSRARVCRASLVSDAGVVCEDSGARLSSRARVP